MLPGLAVMEAVVEQLLAVGLSYPVEQLVLVAEVPTAVPAAMLADTTG